jgi:hypothetical protein
MHDVSHASTIAELVIISVSRAPQQLSREREVVTFNRVEQRAPCPTEKKQFRDVLMDVGVRLR